MLIINFLKMNHSLQSVPGICGAHRNSCSEHPKLRWKFAFNSLYINSLEFKELLSLFIFNKKKKKGRLEGLG